ncbi:S-methyl-5'-thioadenosine phosphorylase-like isoform X2 [Salvelinus fontinalis]|uniref:S-methyl-5'-thioadenosine phosphorylase-like isoform X2 n=1 Tax=Salvelinus fontinalis TaxID=8038 RepID=UPI0024853757|nr:S-methyl-5'-thioadenosine phosphorylase-like isoform X2 [Salvelinus fontinalis]
MSASMQIKIGIIGGSGLDDPDILEGRTEKYVDTPYGKPSDALIMGKIKNVECVLLARHGRQHTIMPTDINYQANIWALREEGCTHLLVTTACGSLREEIQPGDIVIIDQFIDRTTKRAQTLYDGRPTSPPGVSHIPMAEPFCTRTREVLLEVARGLGVKCHPQGTVLTIEGPRFSSRAESLMFRQWGADVINMTSVPEVVLAKEAGLCYASIAMATDYDCWKEHEEAVSFLFCGNSLPIVFFLLIVCSDGLATESLALFNEMCALILSAWRLYSMTYFIDSMRGQGRQEESVKHAVGWIRINAQRRQWCAAACQQPRPQGRSFYTSVCEVLELFRGEMFWIVLNFQLHHNTDYLEICYANAPVSLR